MNTMNTELELEIAKIGEETIVIERKLGILTLSTVRDGRLVAARYIGYSKRQALRLFKEQYLTPHH
jgi:hypothetical protein